MAEKISIDFYFFSYDEEGFPMLSSNIDLQTVSISDQETVSINDHNALDIVKKTLISTNFGMLPGYIELKWNNKIILGLENETADLLVTWDSLLSGMIRGYQKPPWPLLFLSTYNYEFIATEKELELIIFKPKVLEPKDEQIHFKHIPLEAFNNVVFDASKRFIDFINNFDFDEEESSYEDLLETQDSLLKKYSR